MLLSKCRASGRSEGDSTGPGAHSSSSSLHGTPSSIDDLPNADSLLRDIEPSTPGFGNTFFSFIVYIHFFIVYHIFIARYFCILLHVIFIFVAVLLSKI